MTFCLDSTIIKPDDHKQITLPDSRYYRRNGEFYPSVTYVLNSYPKGRHFEDWLKKVGYSGHYPGIDDAIIAICNGAEFIEKHFTIDKNYSDFRDHQLSADPNEMKLLVNKIRKTEIVLGEENNFNQK